jgi:lipoprotein-releasing system ATP-binding protein
MADPVLACRQLSKSFVDGNRCIDVLSNLELSLEAGERIAIVGQSGSGKSTLLNLLGGLDDPSAGSVWVSGQNLSTLSEQARCRWRNRSLGFVFQFHHLLPEFSALEAVAMPARIAGLPRELAFQRAKELLTSVGLSDRLSHRPAMLSGGERQRVAIARALINRPSCVLMDEPTGNLDPQAAERVLDLMAELERDETGFVVVTHDPGIALRMDRQLELRDGHLVPLQ